MPEPDHTPIGARLRERTQPLAPDDESYGWAHAFLCEAIGRMYKQVAEVFDPEGDAPPLAPILDPELCPAWALPWLAQLVGVQLPAGTPEDTARAMIVARQGFQRGTPAAMEAAVAALLTGSQIVWFRERDGGAYQLEIVTLTGQTPDPAAVERALLTQKPGGIVLRYRTVDAWDYQQMTTEGGTYADQSAAFATYIDLREHEVTP